MATTPSRRHNRRSGKQPVRRVSVVTVCWNTRDTIRLTLESIARQSFADVEHVVIDGGSTDGTQDIVREYDVGYFVSEKDNGIYDAMEKGARAATGDILIFLNAGDVFYDDDVAAQVARFFDATGADIVFGNLMPAYLHPSDRHDHNAFRPGHLLDLGYVRNRRQLYNESIHHQATFYRRWIFDRCSYVCQSPEATGEYHLLLQAVMQQNARVKHIPLPISRFMLGGTSTRDFAVEWPRYVKARDILRSMYLPDPAKLRVRDANEFSATPARREASALRAKIWLKRLIKSSPIFRIYERLALSVSARVVNQLLPQMQQQHQDVRQVQELLLTVGKNHQTQQLQHHQDLTQLRQMLKRQQSTLCALAQIAARLETLDAAHQIASARAAELGAGQQAIGERVEALAGMVASLQTADVAASRTREQIQLNLSTLLQDAQRSAGFKQSGFKAFSQWDEDGLLQYLIGHCNIDPQTFVEIGTGDYTEANTRLLLQKDGWSGVLIDCDAAAMRRVRDSELYWRYPLRAVEAFVDADNVNELLRSNGVEGEIGLLSIDIDGVDYWVWKAITAVAPQIVVCEYNGLFGSEARVTVPYSPRFDRTSEHYSWLYAGASLGALQHLAKQKGYTLIGTNSGGNNAFFVRDDILHKSGVQPVQHPYTRPTFRESRNPDGSLSFLDVADGIELIRDKQVWDIEHEKLVRIADIPLSYR